MSATTIRCSIATDNGKIATWMDELLGYVGNKMEHVATSYPEFALDKIISLNTCTLYTVARTESGELFWWGVLPFAQRKKLWDKYKAKSKKPVRKDKDKDQGANEIVVGSQVCMKSSPMYQPGAIGFCISNGVPKVGQLLNAAWDLMNICRFKILPMSSIQLPPGASMMSAATLTANLANSGIDLKESLGKLSSSGSNSNPGTTAPTPAPPSSSSVGKSNANVGNKESTDRLDMPPPPSPASSTCSDTGSVSNKRQKRMLPKEDPDSKKDEEIWSLK